MVNYPKCIDVVIPVWGEEYVRFFCEMVVPNLLSKGNLGDLNKIVDCEIYLFTNENSYVGLAEHPAVIDLSKKFSLCIRIIENQASETNKYSIMSMAHDMAIKKALISDSALLFINADVLFSVNSLKRIGELIKSGKRVIEMIGFRTIKEGMEKTLKAKFQDAGNVIDIEADELLELSLKNMHNISLSHFVDIKNPPLGGHLPFNHYWSVGSMGIVGRGSHLFPIYVYPERKSYKEELITIDWNFVEAVCPKKIDRYVVQDPQEIFIVEVSDSNYTMPVSKKFGLFYMANFILTQCSKHHIETFSKVIKFRFKDDNCKNSKWRFALLRSNFWYFTIMSLSYTYAPFRKGCKTGINLAHQKINLLILDFKKLFFDTVYFLLSVLAKLGLKIDLNYYRVSYSRYQSQSISYWIKWILKKLFIGAMGIVALPIALIAHFLGYRVVNIFYSRIGHLAIEPDCLVNEKRLGFIGKERWVLAVHDPLVANSHLIKYWENDFIIVRNRLLRLFFRVISQYGLVKRNVSQYINEIPGPKKAYQIYKASESLSPNLVLSCEDEEWGSEQLQALGLPLDSWFVCLHCRESGFSPADDEIHLHRNSDIENTRKAVQEVVNRGGWVIRMGDPSMKKMEKIEGLIDYAHSHLKSPRLDVILSAKCKFFLGNTSGLMFVSMIFGVPCAAANLIPLNCNLFKKDHIYIPKLYGKSTGTKLIPFPLIASSSVGSCQYSTVFKSENYEIYENSEEDIKDLVIEMFELLNGELKNDSSIQKTVNDMRQGLDFGYHSNSKISQRFFQKYRHLFE